MGGYGMQCMLSGLQEGREVRTGLLLLYSYGDYKIENGAPNGAFDYQYDLALPPLWGDYDGYGSVKVEDEDGVLCSWAKDYLRSIGIGTAFRDLTLLQYALQEDVVKVKMASKGTLSYALVREDAWNEMVALSTESALNGKTIYPLPKVKSEKTLRKAFDLVLGSVARKTPLKEGTLAHSVHRLIFAGFKLPEAYLTMKGDTVPEEITRSAFETFMVTMGMEELGIVVQPGITGSQRSNTQARRAFFERMLKLCDEDVKRELEGDG